MKNKVTEISKMNASELIRERARVLAEIRKFEKDELPADAWLTDPKPDMIYVHELERLTEICNAQITLCKKEQ